VALDLLLNAPVGLVAVLLARRLCPTCAAGSPERRTCGGPRWAVVALGLGALAVTALRMPRSAGDAVTGRAGSADA
jgi:hypothetical protein